MADQPINGLPKKTAAADTDALLMIGASEEYQIDYGKLADAILNKLTNKTFALDQGSKSLVAALNELNSKIQNIYCGNSSELTCSVKPSNKYIIIANNNGSDGMSGYKSLIFLVHFNHNKDKFVIEHLYNPDNLTVQITVNSSNFSAIITKGDTEVKYIKAVVISI